MNDTVQRLFAVILFLLPAIAVHGDNTPTDKAPPPKVAQIIQLYRDAERFLAQAQYAEASETAQKILQVEPDSKAARNLLSKIEWQRQHSIGDFNTEKERSYRKPQNP